MSRSNYVKGSVSRSIRLANGPGYQGHIATRGATLADGADELKAMADERTADEVEARAIEKHRIYASSFGIPCQCSSVEAQDVCEQLPALNYWEWEWQGDHYSEAA